MWLGVCNILTLYGLSQSLALEESLTQVWVFFSPLSILKAGSSFTLLRLFQDGPPTLLAYTPNFVSFLFFSFLLTLTDHLLKDQLC